MVNTSDRPISVDGVRLDTLAWNISKISRAVASRRAGDVTLPGVDGGMPSLNDNLEPVTLGLDMFVMGTDADGAVPGAGRRDTFRANLDELVHLFGKRHALLEVTEQVNATETRRAWAKVTDSLAPDINTPGSNGQFTVGLLLPYAVWEDPDLQDWNGTLNSAAVQEVTTLRGATERTTDAVALVHGPYTNPRVTDPTTGAYVQYSGTLSSSQLWRVNVGTWSSRVGTTLALGSADTDGTDVQPQTSFGGTRNQAAFLPLVPVRDTGQRRVKVQVTGTGSGAASRVSIRARRKFAL